jgi:hypothetical protein
MYLPYNPSRKKSQRKSFFFNKNNALTALFRFDFGAFLFKKSRFSQNFRESYQRSSGNVCSGQRFKASRFHSEGMGSSGHPRFSHPSRLAFFSPNRLFLFSNRPFRCLQFSTNLTKNSFIFRVCDFGDLERDFGRNSVDQSGLSNILL